MFYIVINFYQSFGWAINQVLRKEGQHRTEGLLKSSGTDNCNKLSLNSAQELVSLNFYLPEKVGILQWHLSHWFSLDGSDHQRVCLIFHIVP
jgi:hypothetical protein